MFNEVASNFCTRCGAPLAADARFCAACGHVVGTPLGTPLSGVPTIELAGVRYEVASFWRHLGAFLIDGLFWNVVSWPLSAVMQISPPGGNPFPTLEPGAQPTAEFWGAFAETFDSLMVYVAISTVTFGVAQVALEAYGWTPGKATLRLRIIRRDGHPPGIVHGLARSFTRILSLLPFLLGYFWVAWDPHRQAWHDKLAHVYVVRVPDPALGGVAPQRPEGWGPLALGVGPWIWATLNTLFLAGTVAGTLALAAIVPDDGAAWQRFFDGLATPTPTRTPGFRTAIAPSTSPAVLLIDVRDAPRS